MITAHWGKLPETLKTECHKKYWGNTSKRRALLRHEIAFPIVLSLKTPTGSQALANPEYYKHFVAAWRHFKQPESLVWTTQKLVYFGEQYLPTALQFNDANALLTFIGEQKIWQRWQNLYQQLCNSLPEHAHSALIDKIEELARLPENQLIMLIHVVLQLRSNMGQNGYLRALPLNGAHSKFIEQHYGLIEYLLIAIHGSSVQSQGLLAWLGCQNSPKDWLLIRPLCSATRAALANLPILRLDTQTLRQTPLPAKRILIVENEQAALSLPEMQQTIVVSGGGRNTAWLTALWLPEKQVAYWGDLDAHGLTILSEARTRLPQLTSLMMNTQVLERFKDFITQDVANTLSEPNNLIESERQAWQFLHSTQPNQRLEQEYLAADFVAKQLEEWISGSLKIQ